MMITKFVNSGGDYFNLCCCSVSVVVGINGINVAVRSLTFPQQNIDGCFQGYRSFEHWSEIG